MQWNEMFAEAGRNTVDVCGLKPQIGDLVQTIPVPDSQFVIRDCCLDFINSLTSKATNSPEAWQLTSCKQARRHSFPNNFARGGCRLHKGKHPVRRGKVRHQASFLLRDKASNQPDFFFDTPAKLTVGAAQATTSRAVA
ncbi:hypothetical protein BT96DRAFT_920852 [Gymnopus androsaceus JB14]|uniref:Uncharacterized protein n=1 Tax=Gymnopus androsaceus JB14 TaxID=1447944 RepID=A0A6A4HLN1_9AGAR|nr:hypothetical protein BT96DRAFT_920852 [Gymnopus androsaceus JB14]